MLLSIVAAGDAATPGDFLKSAQRGTWLGLVVSWLVVSGTVCLVSGCLVVLSGGAVLDGKQ